MDVLCEEGWVLRKTYAWNEMQVHFSRQLFLSLFVESGEKLHDIWWHSMPRQASLLNVVLELLN